jgi:regulation of enolase protein 1 (concanavalin A-like superfamily)
VGLLRMQWSNKPKVIHLQTDALVSFDVAPDTDLYRAADFSVIADNAPLYYKEVKGVINKIDL